MNPVPTEVTEDEEDDGGGGGAKTKCKLWFFSVCIKWADIDVSIGGWSWTLPPGIYGP
jgi:hypothetical protein